MKSEQLYDKTEWPEGPWHNEPDYATFIDLDTLYPCVAKRNILGAWVGYVGIDEGHPLYLKDCSEVEFDYIEVHQEAPTYTAFTTEESLQFTPPKKHWWVGFDCMHDTDLCPPLKLAPARRPKKQETAVYRDFEYVLAQLQSLAYQLSTFDSRFYEQFGFFGNLFLP